jgi:hypothetical protein
MGRECQSYDPRDNLMGAEVGRAAKFTNLHAGATVEALTDSNGKLGNTITRKEQML